MIMLLRHCKLVVTDSGGVQKEAFFFGRHCITLREQTEWVELVEQGFNRIVGTNPDLLQEAFRHLSCKQSDFTVDLYGKGKAAERATEEIVRM
jgi:UDP-GlcNAc3NAcA epimerase